MKCYEIVNCPFNGTDPKDAKCQVYQKQISCWEYDWGVLYKTMPDCIEKEEWRLSMHEHCPKCPAYQKHPAEMNKQLQKIK